MYVIEWDILFIEFENILFGSYLLIKDGNQ